MFGWQLVVHRPTLHTSCPAPLPTCPLVVPPSQTACGWAGLASVGCGGPTCSVYIQGNSALDLDVIMHELGHTQGLSHSGKGWDEVRARCTAAQLPQRCRGAAAHRNALLATYARSTATARM